MNVALLRQGAQAFGLQLEPQAVERFELYMAELLRWGRSINLTAITRPDEVVAKHFVDALSIVPLLAPGDRLLDVGSGAGLPGLVVAIVRADLQITSLDAVDKKVRFQRHVCRLLGLGQVEVLHERVERLALQRAGQFDVVTSRAFRDVGRFAQLSHRLVKPGGRLVAMLSGTGDESGHGGGDLLEQFALQRQQVIAYELPQGMGARKLMVYRRNQL